MKRLSEICKIQYGYAFDSAQFTTDEGLPLIRIRDVIRGYSETFTTEQCSEEYVVDDGDMLIGMDGEFNIAKWRGGTALLNQRVCRLTPSNEVVADYIYYFMPLALKRIEAKTPFVTVKHLSAKELNAVMVPLPSIEKQTRIAESLSRVERLIALRNQQLEKLDALIKARFVEMFGDFQENVKLSDIAKVSGGLTKNSNRKAMHLQLPYLRVANVSFNYIDTSEILKIGLLEEEKEKTLLEYGDLLFVEGNGSPDQIGRVAVWRDEVVPCVHQNHLIKARFSSTDMLSVFAMFYFMTEKGRQQIKSKAVSTSGLYTLSVQKVAGFLLPKPPIKLQKEFVEFVEQVDKSKFAVQKALDETQTLFDSLMQEYFG